MEHGRRSPIADLPATLRMLALVRLLNARLRWRPVPRRAPLGLMAAAPALAFVVAACSGAYGAGAPAYTYAPPSSASASPAMSMSPTASKSAASAAPAASVPASAAAKAAGSTPTIGATLRISAKNIQFNTDRLEAPAGRAFMLVFDNNDPGVPHNIEIRDATGASMFKGKIFTGPAKASYEVPALAAGSYVFLCDVHPTMTGTVTVK